MKPHNMIKNMLLTSIAAIIGASSFAYATSSKPTNPTTNRGTKVVDLSMEDDFKDVPPHIGASLSKSGANKEFLQSGCKKYVGKTVPASINNEKTVWLVTTPGCGWGAHTAPIWVIEESKNESRLIFNGNGIGFELYSKSQNGYRDIVVSDSSAGYYGDIHYKYDGKKYIKFASRFAELSDPDACKIIPDILQCK